MSVMGGAAALVMLSAFATQAEVAEEPLPVARTKIVILDLDSSGVEAAQAELLNGVVAQTLAPFERLEVVTTGDIRRVADLEAQKQALGCDQDSCLAEIAGALGAQYVIFGRVGQLDELILVQLNLFDADAAQPVAREEVRARSLDALVDRMGPATTRLARSLLPATAVIEADMERDGSAADSAGGSVLTSAMRWGGAGLAGVGLVTGIAATVVAGIEAGVVSNDAESAKARNDGKVIGASAVIVAAASGAFAAIGLGVLGVSFLDLE